MRIRKILVLLMILTSILSVNQLIVYADENVVDTSSFARINEDDLEEPTKLTVGNLSGIETLDGTETFSMEDTLTNSQFDTENNVEEITDEKLIQTILPRVSKSRTIIKNEIERIKKEEQKKLEEQKRKEEERKRIERYSQVRTITPASSDAIDVFKATLLSQLGKPYVYGGNGPNYFDCSGLSSYVYKKIGISLPRTASDQQRTGTSVNRTLEDLKFGDLVFFKNPGQSGASHVGIYVGNGQMIHAPQTGDVVKYTNIFTGYYKNRFFSAKRYVDFEKKEEHIQEENKETTEQSTTTETVTETENANNTEVQE